MYSVMPNKFLVPVSDAEEAILFTKKEKLHEYAYSGLRKKHKNRKHSVIGVSLPTQREERWVRDKEVMEAYAKDKGITLKIEIADFDSTKQASQVEKLISQGIDVLIIAPVNPFTAAVLAEKAHKAGIRVVSYDSLIVNSDLDMYVAFDRRKVGELQGKYLVTKVPRGNYIIMSGDPGTLFKEGAMEYIEPLVSIGNINIVTDKMVKGWDPKNAYNIVKESLITANNKVDAVLAPNDATAGAAIEALQEQGLAGKVAVTGQDADLAAIQRIIQGTQSMTVFKDTRELARRAMEVASKLSAGEPVYADTKVNNGKMDVPSILISPEPIDKNNIDSVLIESGYLKKEDVYKIRYRKGNYRSL
ncbi:MAG: substrate-binding domain-containing protein [Clostridiaceae bacterium]